MNDPQSEPGNGHQIAARKRGFLQQVIQRKRLESLFLFVTSRCNSKCRTCFYHAKLNDGRDLSFAAIERLADTAGQFAKLWLSGGEPTMREDLAEVIELFYHRCGIKVVNFPSNGLLPERVEQVLAHLLERCPKLELHVNFSLDGIGETHDAIRGVPGGFRKTLATIAAVRRRFGAEPRVVMNVASVVTPENYDELFDLGAYLLERDLVGAHVFEITRGDPRDPTTKALSARQMLDLYDRVYPLFELQGERLFKDFGPIGRRVANTFFLGFIRFMQELQGANVDGPCDWGMACTAGRTTIVVDHDGQFRACEMRPPIGDLREYGYDIGAALRSAAMRSEITAIGGGSRANCWCTHGCWIMSSMKFSPRTLLGRLPAAYLRSRRLHQPDFRLPQLDPGRIARYEATLDARAAE